MKILAKISMAALFGALVGCQELPAYLAGDRVVAKAGGRELHHSDLRSAVPKGVTGDDSVSFAEVYIDRWTRKQLKLKEAEELFSDSAQDIEKMVEEYRQSLLIRKVDQYYVDRSVDTAFTDDDIAAYYKAHPADFRLDRTVVKGRVLRFAETYRQARKLRELMASPVPARQKDFVDICAKHDFALTEFDQWVDYADFLSYLPTLRSANYDANLGIRSVQQMRDGSSYYYFQIDEVLRPGDPVPLERVRDQIRRILFNQRQSEVIRAHEEELYSRAEADGEVKIYENN